MPRNRQSNQKEPTRQMFEHYRSQINMLDIFGTLHVMETAVEGTISQLEGREKSWENKVIVLSILVLPGNN